MAKRKIQEDAKKVTKGIRTNEHEADMGIRKKLRSNNSGAQQRIRKMEHAQIRRRMKYKGGGSG